MSSVKAVHRFKRYSGAFGEVDSASYLARIERELAEDDEIMRVSEQLLAQAPTLPPPAETETAAETAANANAVHAAGDAVDAAVDASATVAHHYQRPPSWASLPKLTTQYHHVVTATEKFAAAAAETAPPFSSSEGPPLSQLLLPQNKAALAFSNLAKRNSNGSGTSSSSSSSNSSASSSSNDPSSNSSAASSSTSSTSSSTSVAAVPSALKRGRSFESSYALGPALGKGSFSVVHRCYAHNRSHGRSSSSSSSSSSHDDESSEGRSSLSASEPTTCAVKVRGKSPLKSEELVRDVTTQYANALQNANIFVPEYLYGPVCILLFCVCCGTSINQNYSIPYRWSAETV